MARTAGRWIPFALLILRGLSFGPLGAQEVLYDLLVSSRNTHSVKRFDARTGAFVDDFVPPRRGGLESTQEIRLAPDGDILVTGRGNGQVLRYDARTGEYEGSFTRGYALSEPTKMTWGPDGNLYVSQWGAGRENVAVFGPDGAFIREATPTLSDPMQHAWDDEGNLLVVYWGSKDVRRFDREGNQIEVLVADGRLQGPTNLRWDAEQNLQVFDWQSSAVYVYDGQDGSYIGTFIPSLRRPEGWAIGPVDGYLYVAEWDGNAVKRFDAETGALIGTFVSGGGLQAPNSLLFVERPRVFELQASAPVVDFGFGSHASVTLEVTGARGVSFDSPVALACTPGDPRVHCSIDPSTVTPGAAGATATLTVTAPPQSAVPPSLLVGLLLLLAGSAALRRRRRAVVAAALGLAVFASCGGGDGGVGPDLETVDTQVQVTATSDGLSQTISLAVTVR